MLLWGHHYFVQENDPTYTVLINALCFSILRLGSSFSTSVDAYTLDVFPKLQLKDR